MQYYISQGLKWLNGLKKEQCEIWSKVMQYYINQGLKKD